jgi:hypothetical protein
MIEATIAYGFLVALISAVAWANRGPAKETTRQRTQRERIEALEAWLAELEQRPQEPRSGS